MLWLCCCFRVTLIEKRHINDNTVEGTAPPFIEILRGRDRRDDRDGEPGP